MAGHTPWREIKRKRHAIIAREVVECWLRDCVNETRSHVPNLSTAQMTILLRHIECGIHRGEEAVQADRNMWRAKAISFGKWIARIKKELEQL